MDLAKWLYLKVQALEGLVKSERSNMENAFHSQKSEQMRQNDREWQLKLETVNRYPVLIHPWNPQIFM